MNNSGAVSFEIEMVLVLIAALSMAIILYLNVKNLINKTYDVKRLNDTVAISEAISLYTIERGNVPIEIGSNEKEIGTIYGGCNYICGAHMGCVNLLPLILSHLQIKNLSSLEGYTVKLGEGGMITVKSCISRSGKIIEVTR